MTTETKTEKMQQADHDVLIRLDSKIDSLTTEMRQQNGNLITTATDHEGRLRVLEKANDAVNTTSHISDTTKNKAIAILGVLAAALTAYATYVAGRHP